MKGAIARAHVARLSCFSAGCCIRSSAVRFLLIINETYRGAILCNISRYSLTFSALAWAVKSGFTYSYDCGSLICFSATKQPRRD
jgi:hypothetical protein